MADIKLTEIILSMNEKIDSLLELVKLIDNNQKIILLRMSKLHNEVSISAEIQPPQKSLLPGVKEVAEDITGSIVVQQLVIYPDKSPVRMAKVEILSGDVVVKKIYSGHNGKWISRLNPGEYGIRISKSEKVINDSILVTNDVSPQELFAIVLK